MNEPALLPEPEKPWWARPGVWFFWGTFAAVLSFMWVERVQVFALYRAHMPGARAVGKRLYTEAHTLTGRPVLEEEADDPADHPSAANLSAPVDPARGFNKVERNARVRTTARGRRMMRDVRGRGRSSAGEVQEVRAYMEAPAVSFQRELTFWESDLGIGIQMSLGISFCFFVVGHVLFRNKRSRY